MKPWPTLESLIIVMFYANSGVTLERKSLPSLLAYS